VKMVFFLIVAMAFGLVKGILVPRGRRGRPKHPLLVSENLKSPRARPSVPIRILRDVPPIAEAVTRISVRSASVEPLGGHDIARLVLPQALGKAAARYSTRPEDPRAHDQHVLGEPALAAGHVTRDARARHFLPRRTLPP